jgi:pseudouridine-5'-phosphate glycosidase
VIPLAKSREVQAAEAENIPIVALESTIITHGLPWPKNLETALSVEETVRAAGAVPATIAVIGGVIQAGLDKPALESLAQARDVAKLSRADLAPVLAMGRDGSTTVAATMICAHLAGIACFATGGIGGVHRGAENSFDISADLDELSKTPVTVICAGAKAILDIPKTLEALETRGVPVIGWRTDDFPAFWSASSGLPVPLRMDDADAVARAHKLRGDLGLDGGQLVVNPIPAEYEIPYLEISPAIETAIDEAEAKGITGKAVTPFLLERVLEATQGRSQEANIALVRNNARLAAEIAVALNHLT